jgi:hypothetical protein
MSAPESAAIGRESPTASTRRRPPIALRPAPDREPRFDDERPRRHLSLVGPDAIPLPFRNTEMTNRLSSAATASPPRPDDAPEPVVFGRSFVQAAVEVLCGRRPAGQLARHTSPSVHAGLVRDQARGRHRFDCAGRNPVVHSVHIMEPAARVAEVAAVVQVGTRYRAIAARLEARDGRWYCVRLQVG